MVPPEPQKQAVPPACWSDDRQAQRYDRSTNRAFYQAALAALLDGAPALAGRGLDLGCGTGFATEVLVERYPTLAWQAVDGARSMVALARRKSALARVGFSLALAESLPLADRSLDVVVANFAWHWFGPAAAHEVRRVLRPGGWLLATVPLRLFSGASGNRALARALLADRRRFQTRPSQGLRFEATRALLPGPVHLARHELHVGREAFADGRELVDVLDSRGALTAIFGDHPPRTIAGPAPLAFTWPFAIVHLQVVT